MSDYQGPAIKVIYTDCPENPKAYTYKCDFEVAIGDYVVVPVGLPGSYKVGKVVKQTNHATIPENYKSAICKVNL